MKEENTSAQTTASMDMCPHCGGSGESVADQKCWTCDGTGGVYQGDDGCCHKTRLKGSPCPIGWNCPHGTLLAEVKEIANG